MPKESTPEIFGIPIDNRSKNELERVVGDCLVSESFTRIATVNPEFLVRARCDASFADLLRSADIRIADGSGIVLAGLLSGVGVSRYPGVDLMRFILLKAQQLGTSVFVAMRKDGLSSYGMVREALQAMYPHLIIDGADIDPSSRDILAGIKNSTVVLCNFGVPEQESFVESLRADRGAIRLVMGIGGAFDFLTGKRRRAPRFMRAIGLEWLFRLIIQPSRVARIWTAVVVFPFFWLSDRIRK